MNSCRISRVPHYSGAVWFSTLVFAYGAFTLCGRLFQSRSADHCKKHRRRSYNPTPAVTGVVWAGARSLATTCAITVVFFSSGYLDVSVPRVSSALCAVPRLPAAGCPIRKSVLDSGYLPLGTAYRSLSRPSSPSRAKASFMCPFLLSFYVLEFAFLRAACHVCDMRPLGLL